MNHRRKKIFVDNRLQGRLILAMVIVEMVILAVAMFYLNYRFASIIEDNLYSIHRSSQEDMLLVFASQIGWVVFEMGVLNVMMLFTAHYFWSQQIGTVVEVFRKELSLIRSLNFSKPDHVDKPIHELLTLVELWFSSERKRVSRLKSEIQKIHLSDEYNEEELLNIKAHLHHCQELLHIQRVEK